VALRQTGEPLHELLWLHAPAPRPAPRSLADLPSTTSESDSLAKRLRGAGFRFVGPTTVYAAMQACGVVNDHIADCWVREDVERERAR
jgi:DNA-3-methyladenine glycosylase I